MQECIVSSEDDLWNLIWNPDPKSTLDVLAAALERLDADELLRQVPGGEDLKRRALQADVRVRIAERDRLGLLSVVADCLDRLLVAPNFPACRNSTSRSPRTSRGQS